MEAENGRLDNARESTLRKEGRGEYFFVFWGHGAAAVQMTKSSERDSLSASSTVPVKYAHPSLMQETQAGKDVYTLVQNPASTRKNSNSHYPSLRATYPDLGAPNTNSTVQFERTRRIIRCRAASFHLLTGGE